MRVDLNEVSIEVKDCKDADYTPDAYTPSGKVYHKQNLTAFLAARDLPSPIPYDAACLMSKAIVAGGYMASFVCGRPGGSPGDIDFWFRCETDLVDTVRALRAAGWTVRWPMTVVGDIDPSSEAFKAAAFVEVEPPVQGWGGPSQVFQLVKIRYYKDAEEVVDAFDFTCVQFAWDIASDTLVYAPDAAIDCSARRIIQHRVESRDRTVKRLIKYRGKGFQETAAFKLPEKP